MSSTGLLGTADSIPAASLILGLVPAVPDVRRAPYRLTAEPTAAPRAEDRADRVPAVQTP